MFGCMQFMIGDVGLF